MSWRSILLAFGLQVVYVWVVAPAWIQPALARAVGPGILFRSIVTVLTFAVAVLSIVPMYRDATKETIPPDRPGFARWFAELAEGGIWALLGLGLFMMLAGGMTGVTGTGMAPTILDGDRLLLSRLALNDGLEAGDLVSVRGADGKTYIRRVVGMPGDELRMMNGRFERNGVTLEEPYLPKSVTALPFPDRFTVPAATVVVARDQRRTADDVMVVEVRRVEGKVVFRYAPLSRAGSLLR